MNWLNKILPKVNTNTKKGVPEGLWTKCLSCNSVLYHDELKRQLKVCPKCGYHFHISARERLNYFLDPGDNQRKEIATNILPIDWLNFRDSKKYKDRLSAAKKKSGETEAVIVMQGTLNQLPLIAIFFDFNFIGGSMGSAVGARFVEAVHQSIEKKLPLVCFSTSGGARMQESVVSLFQMAKTSAALARLAEKKLPYISVLLDPTTGGVSASLAMLGDIIIAEPNALIGFSGPRVIEQTIREKLPEGFQRSEFLLKHGAIDMIVDRRQMRDKIYELLMHLK